MQEIRYKIINGFENYIVFDNGLVLSKINKKILKPSNCHGYQLYCLHNNKKQTMKFAHRLVAEAFILNPQNLKTVNHIDENKKNNSFENLEWMSIGDNNAYSKSKNIAMIKDGTVIKIFKSASEASRQCGFSRCTICKCCNEKRKQTGGFEWKYLSREEAEQHLKGKVEGFNDKRTN